MRLLAFTITLLICGAALTVSRDRLDRPVGFDLRVKEEGAIPAAIWWITENQPNNCRAKVDPVYRAQLGGEFKAAGKLFQVPTLMLTGMGYRESIYNPKKVGSRGELGVLQVGPFLRKKCKDYCRDMVTTQDQINCGACGFRVGWDFCRGDLTRGLVAYASGKCASDHPRVVWATRKRLRTWGRLRKLVGPVDKHGPELWKSIPVHKLRFLTRPGRVRDQGIIY